MHIWRILTFLTICWQQAFGCLDVSHGTCEIRDSQHLICVGASPSEFPLPAHLRKFVTNLTLCAWPYKTFQMEKHIGEVRWIEHITITQSDVEWLDSFRICRKLLTVNVTRLGIAHIQRDLFLGLELLYSIDLRHNRISTLDPQILLPLSNLRSLYLAGNNWRCDSSLAWVISDTLGSKVCDRELMLCEGNSSGLLRAYPKPLVQVMKIIQVMEVQCPVTCNCSLIHVVRAYTDLVEERGQLLPHIAVNCTNRNLTVMPDRLPDYTTALYLHNNNISLVEELAFNKHYQDVRDVFLDGNQITSINILEGTPWISNFGILSLRDNRLQEVPLYVLDHAFGRQSSISHIFLGNNPWRCNCEFTIHFQDFLKKYSRVISDFDDVRCEKMIGDERSNVKIVDLQRLDLCQNHDIIRLTFLDKLNIFLASMLFLVLSTFLYNFIVYKTSGKLPWMVAKLF